MRRLRNGRRDERFRTRTTVAQAKEWLGAECADRDALKSHRTAPKSGTSSVLP